SFANPAGDPHWSAPTIGDLAPGYSLHWSINGSGQLVGTLFHGAQNLGDAIFLQLSGSTSIAAHTSGSPTVTVTIAEALQHSLPGNDQITISGLVVEGSDGQGNFVLETVNVTIVDDVPGAPTVTVTGQEPILLTFDGGLANGNFVGTQS